MDLEAQSDQPGSFVSDPIPAGATILGTPGSEGISSFDAGEGKKGVAWPAYEERSFERSGLTMNTCRKGNGVWSTR